MSRLTSNKLQGAAETLWNLAKGSLMVVGLVALVAWEMQTFSYAKPATIPDAGPPVLSSVQPLTVRAATAAQAEEADVDQAALGSADGHKRITKGEQFTLVGGSEETHGRMTETVVKTFEELKHRRKHLSEVEAKELAEIIHKSTPR